MQLYIQTTDDKEKKLEQNMDTKITQLKNRIDKQVMKSVRRTEGKNMPRYSQKISNYKTPGHDGLHEYWFKKVTFIHEIGYRSE